MLEPPKLFDVEVGKFSEATIKVVGLHVVTLAHVLCDETQHGQEGKAWRGVQH